jgi:putative FmdB family regulatory protein
MPIYEYRCGQCGQVSTFFTRSIGASLEPACRHCKSTDVQRRMSSFVQGKTVQSVHERFPSLAGASTSDYYSDPRNIGRHVEDSFQRFGMDVPPSVRETIDAAREGGLPPGMDA